MKAKGGGSQRSLFDAMKKRIRQKIAPIKSVQTKKPYVAITFDDGPHPVYTPILLRIFEKFNSHGTFFMVGRDAQRYRSIVQEVAEAGHEIGNHTMDHISMRSVNRCERWKQIKMCKTELYPYGQKYFRPPHGEQNGWSNLDALLLGYTSIGWNLDVEDWWNTDFSSMAAALRQRISPGSILLFHDSIFDKGHPKHKVVTEKACLNRDVMSRLVEVVLEEFFYKYQFVTVSELLKSGSALRV
jgi:peptidoglycan/xylan/chitin deacetylase (PgdA/CDA1 family)